LWPGVDISRAAGACFLSVYVAYVAYLVLAAKSHAALEPFSWIMLEFAAPLSVVAVVAYLYPRAHARRRQSGASTRAA
jgi:cation:H+ antiporter